MAALEVGDRVRFDGKATSWLVRASACAGRYHLATASLFGAVHYTIIDHEQGIRGPMNVIGWGLGIFTTCGDDEAIDAAVRMLEEGYGTDENWYPRWEVSRRGQVPLRITHRKTKGA